MAPHNGYTKIAPTVESVFFVEINPGRKPDISQSFFDFFQDFIRVVVIYIYVYIDNYSHAGSPPP